MNPQLSSFIPHPSSLDNLERETRLELATLALARRCSTTELLPLWSSSDSNDSMFVVKRGSFQHLIQYQGHPSNRDCGRPARKRRRRQACVMSLKKNCSRCA